jgi:hypothetical protein
MADYIEIEDPIELRKLNRELGLKLKRVFGYGQMRTIGSPGGNFPAKVRFRSRSGENVFWWAPLPRKKRLEKNLFGRGTPGRNDSLNMDVQFNLPVVRFSRGSGGAFLRHLPTNTIVLAHRGIVTIGHGRVPKDVLFEQMDATRREARTATGPADFLLIGELESSTLVNDLDSFAAQVRGVVQRARMMKDGKTNQGEAKASVRTKKFAKLRAYFHEFSGTPEVKGRTGGIADCYHGDVVRALKDSLDGSCTFRKSREIDLVIGFKSKTAFLFEAKTSPSTQSVYTAVGQLAVHAPRVAREFRPARLRMVIVLPGQPAKHLHEILTRELGILVLTFTRSVRGKITIAGLEKLV